MNILKKLFGFTSSSYNSRYINLSDIFYIGKLGRINYTGFEYVFGFNLVLNSGVTIIFSQSTKDNQTPQEVDELRGLLISKMGFSFTEISDKYSNINIKVKSI